VRGGARWHPKPTCEAQLQNTFTRLIHFLYYRTHNVATRWLPVTELDMEERLPRPPLLLLSSCELPQKKIVSQKSHVKILIRGMTYIGEGFTEEGERAHEHLPFGS
jgi:hypothetical protein